MKCGEQQKKNGGEGGNEEVKGKTSKRGLLCSKKHITDPCHVCDLCVCEG